MEEIIAKRFRGKPQREVDDTRINGLIRVKEIRCIGADGEAIGVISTRDGLERAEAAGLDLVEVSENAKPPVCRIMDYGKFKYEKAKKLKESKKKQVKVQNKELKLHLKTDKHDYDFKMKNAFSFLEKGHRVKITMVFRGREIVYKDLGRKKMEMVDKDLSVIAAAERKYVMEGRNMISNYVLDKKKLKDYLKAKEDAEKAEMSEETPAEISEASTEE